MKKIDIIDWILSQSNTADLEEVREALKDRVKTLSTRLKYELKPGMKVKVSGSKKITKGEVKRVNKTRAILNVVINGVEMQYSVPFSMISI